MIAFQDFIPQIQRKRLLGVMSDYEPLEEVVTRVNRWIAEQQIEVFSIETLLVPALPPSGEATKARLESPNNTFSTYQFVRVWYRPSAVQPSYTGITTRLDQQAGTRDE